MKAVVLVGGFGTRLRPLTLTVPKPLIPFANTPLTVHQLKALKDFGVSEVILAVSEKPSQDFKEVVAKWEAELGISIQLSIEDTPLGTAGPLGLLQDSLGKDPEEPFFVLNSDIICDYPLKELLEFHKSHGKEGTIAITPVEDPQKYGVIAANKDTGRIEIFAEKQEESVSNTINAGIYCFSPAILKRIPANQRCSLETEIFPEMVNQGQLFSYALKGYWMDIDDHTHYLQGTAKYLTSLPKTKLYSATPDSEVTVNGAVLVAESAKIGKGTTVGPNVVIGPSCEIGVGVRLSNCVLLAGTTVHDHAIIKDTIIGDGCSIGKWCRVVATTVLGEDVQIADELFVKGALVLPHKYLKESVPEPRVIL